MSAWVKPCDGEDGAADNRGVREITRREIITNAIDGQLSYLAAADIIPVTPRQMRRMQRAIEPSGITLRGCRSGDPWSASVCPTYYAQAGRVRQIGGDLNPDCSQTILPF